MKKTRRRNLERSSYGTEHLKKKRGLPFKHMPRPTAIKRLNRSSRAFSISRVRS